MPLTSTTFFGTPGVAGDDSTHMRQADHVETDADANVYILENYALSTSRIRKITPSGSVSTVASASGITNFAVSPTGVVYYVATDNKIHKVVGGSTTVLSGSGTMGYQDDVAANAQYDWSQIPCMVVHGLDLYLFQDVFLRKVDTTSGTATFVAGSTHAITDGTGASAAFRLPQQRLVTDGTDLWMIDTVPASGDFKLRKVTTAGVVTTVVSITVSTINGATGLPDPAPRTLLTYEDFNRASDGNFYFPWWWHDSTDGGYYLVTRITPAGVVTVIQHWAALGGNPGKPYEVVPDSTGDLLIEILTGVTGGTLGYTIQKLASAFTPPAADPKLSTLTDAFNTLNTAKWTATGGPAGIVGGALQLGDPTTPVAAIRAVATYDFDSAELEVIHAGQEIELLVEATDSTDYLNLFITGSFPAQVQAGWFIDGVAGYGDAVDYDLDLHRRIKILRNEGSSNVTFLTSADGLTWDTLTTIGLSTGLFRHVKAHIVGDTGTLVDNFNIAALAPGETPPIPTEPITLPNPFEPGATLPSNTGTETRCVTLLDLIREFSAAVMKPIRILGPATIEMVDINAPLPTGWVIADAPDVYTTTTIDLEAGENALSLDVVKLVINASADVKANDVRLVVSDWRIPEQLPVYSLGSCLVKRVSCTYTPDECKASLDFHCAPVPITVMRS